MAMEDAIVGGASSEEENQDRPQRRTRKPSAKARQNEGSQDALDVALLATKRQPGGGPRAAAANGAAASVGGGSEQVTLATLQRQVNEQIRVMKQKALGARTTFGSVCLATCLLFTITCHSRVYRSVSSADGRGGAAT